MAEKDGIKEAATTSGISPVLLVVALLAFAAGRAADRAAARIAHRLLGHVDEKRIQELVLLLEE